MSTKETDAFTAEPGVYRLTWRGRMKTPPTEIDGCPVFVSLTNIEDDSGETDWYYVYPEDEADDRVWMWNERTGKVEKVQ